MISSEVIASFSENEVNFLIYFLNKDMPSEIFSRNSLKCIRIDVLKKKLEINRNNVKDEYKQEYLQFCEKINTLK